MLRIAIKGNLSEGSKFVDLIRNNSDCSLSGLCTASNTQLSENEKLIDHPVPVYDNLKDLYQISDAIIFLNHKKTEYLEVKQALRLSKHVFIHPKDFFDPDILSEYQNLAEEAGVLFYIFHNPIKRDIENIIDSCPEYIDISRNVNTSNGNTQDLRKLLLQEILYLTSVNQQAIKKFKITSVPYNSLKPYLINIIIDFSNYSSVNLTINNFSAVDSRQTKVYYRNRMFAIDTVEKNIKILHLNNPEKSISPLQTLINNETDPSIDIERFINKLKRHAYPANNFESGFSAYNNSWEILEKIVPALLEK